MKTKVVYKSSIFPADIDCVFSLLRNLETLQYIAKPYASFTPIGGNSNIRWEEGQTISFKFKLFCFIPYGTHTIHVIDFSKHSIYTNESNTHVPVWNHSFFSVPEEDKAALKRLVGKLDLLKIQSYSEGENRYN